MSPISARSVEQRIDRVVVAVAAAQVAGHTGSHRRLVVRFSRQRACDFGTLGL
jgi:hypothetical protein